MDIVGVPKEFQTAINLVMAGKSVVKSGKELGKGVNLSEVERKVYDVGIYKDIKGTKDLDAHHVGQKALMENFIPEYDSENAPAILVPKVGHTIKDPEGIVSRTTKGFTNGRQVIARDIMELKRVYPSIPNSQLQLLIEYNKKIYNILNFK